MAAPATEGYVVTPRSSGRPLRALWRGRGVVLSLALRDLQVRYRVPAVGLLWAVAQPLALTVATSLVFHGALAVRGDGGPYPVFVFTGLAAWTYFQGVVTAAVPSLVNDANLVRKIWFPREAIPLAPVLAGLLDLVAAGLAFGGLAALFGVPLTLHALWALPLLLLLVAFTAGCALLGAAVNVPYRDVKHAVPLLLQLLFFATPIVYPLSAVPAGWRPALLANPLAGVVEGLRAVLVHGRAPETAHVLSAAGVSLGVLAVAYVLYKAADRRFADVV